MTRDLTQQKIAQDQLSAYLAELEVQNKEPEQFAYVASHDLQEPLRKIQTFSELIKENYDDKESGLRYLSKLGFSARRMSELIRSLLDYSRLANDPGSQILGKVDLNNTISDVRQDFELMIGDKKAVFISDGLPEVRGSGVQLAQLFSNLLSNSLKFSDKPPVIHISSSVIPRESVPNAPKTLAADEYHQIIFKDNGIGFEGQYKEKIFSLFQRHHSKKEYAGTGIGLALCRKIAENHHGFIDAAGNPGTGAAFYIYLPNE